MYDDHTQLHALQEKLVRKAKIEVMLESLHNQLNQLQVEEEQLAAQLSKEQADVDRLEKSSLAAFFYAALNKKEEKMDKEKAEAYAAAVKYHAVHRQAEAVAYDLQTLEAELQTLSPVQTAYNRLFAKKQAEVKAKNPVFGAELCRTEDALGYLTAQKQEIDEAFSVGQEVLSRISSIEDSLDSAEGWGTWDLLGGGLISDLAKHSHLDEAQMQINELQHDLLRYHTELADVTVQADIQAQIDGFLLFADYFFDGLFADWAVLDSIHTSQEEIDATRIQVEGIQEKLGQMRSDMTLKEDELRQRIQELVLQA